MSPRRIQAPFHRVYLSANPLTDPDMSGVANIPHPRNEPVLSYAPGTPERAALKAALGGVGAEQTDIPVVVGGQARSARA